MPIEMINQICAAEEDSRQLRATAQQSAQDAINGEESAGREKVASTLARAETEIAHLTRMSDQKATQHAMELASSTANRLATLRARAERRLNSAAQLIFERIVNADGGC